MQPLAFLREGVRRFSGPKTRLQRDIRFLGDACRLPGDRGGAERRHSHLPQSAIPQSRGVGAADPQTSRGDEGDQKVVVSRDWPSPESRLKGARAVLSQLADMAEAA
jgi:hypothetical protein